MEEEEGLKTPRSKRATELRDYVIGVLVVVTLTLATAMIVMILVIMNFNEQNATQHYLTTKLGSTSASDNVPAAIRQDIAATQRLITAAAKDDVFYLQEIDTKVDRILEAIAKLKPP